MTNAWLIYTQVNRTVYKDKKVAVKSDYTFCMGVTLGNLTVYKKRYDMKVTLGNLTIHFVWE